MAGSARRGETRPYGPLICIGRAGFHPAIQRSNDARNRASAGPRVGAATVMRLGLWLSFVAFGWAVRWL